MGHFQCHFLSPGGCFLRQANPVCPPGSWCGGRTDAPALFIHLIWTTSIICQRAHQYHQYHPCLTSRSMTPLHWHWPWSNYVQFMFSPHGENLRNFIDSFRCEDPNIEIPWLGAAAGVQPTIFPSIYLGLFRYVISNKKGNCFTHPICPSVFFGGACWWGCRAFVWDTRM